MRLSKTNPGCILILKNNLFNGIAKKVVKLSEERMASFDVGGQKTPYWFMGFKDSHRIKIAKTVYENSQLVSVESLSDMVELDTKYRDFVILYHIDKMAYVRKIGAEVAFIIVDFSGVSRIHGRHEGSKIRLGNYNFISQSFWMPDEVEEGKELLRILIYLFYGDITTRFIQAKEKAKVSATTTILNDSGLGIFYANSLWRQRINVSGFKVRGHFRLQPHGEGRAKRKLIWIEEFSKMGYNRRATKEISESEK